ncbi:bifunctional hydroxymethylpyrimidine kinase/phosphomethylpyrimidine kinase [Alphaproteobacteria bacterium]|nr:bifunctional hydroxymethylpyrimidine kinase/phosphomethylpyrimidine kinase [Alphaproteobacteria bacterium]
MVRKTSILVISSQVVSGQVGLKAMLPGFRLLGFETITLQTTLLAAHPAAFPDMGPPVGRTVPAKEILKTFDWLLKAGALDQVGAIISGYLPTPSHVDAIAKIVTDLRAKNQDVTYCCDPICGDNEELYLPAQVAQGLVDQLLPLADLAAPNCFELQYLTQSGPLTTTQEVVHAARSLQIPHVAVTSSPSPEGRIATLAVGTETARCETAKAPHAPHGMGDLFSALYLGLHLAGEAKALGIATGTLAHIANVNMETQTLPHGPLSLAAPTLQETLVVPTKPS